MEKGLDEQRQLSSVFEGTRDKHEDSLKQKLKEDRLYKQIGHLKVEVDFLKDSCDQLGVTLPEDGLR